MKKKLNYIQIIYLIVGIITLCFSICKISNYSEELRMISVLILSCTLILTTNGKLIEKVENED